MGFSLKQLRCGDPAIILCTIFTHVRYTYEHAHTSSTRRGFALQYVYYPKHKLTICGNLTGVAMSEKVDVHKDHSESKVELPHFAEAQV